MRSVGAIIAASLLACALPATSRAAESPAAPASGSSGMTNPAAPVTCNCPPVHHVWRGHRHAHYHARHWRRRPAQSFAAAPPPYNPLLPITTDTAYDRAMVLHYRSPVVTGRFVGDPGFPPTPPVNGVYPYRAQSGAAVYQFDGMANGYVALSQYDARRVGPVAPPPAPH